MKTITLRLAATFAFLWIVALHAGAQSPTTLPAGLRRWTLSASPILRIGTEGDSSSEFLRIGAVTRMPSGEIIVANGATGELRVFSRTGEFVRSLSRRGQGPGELSNFTQVFRGRDTLFVAEFSPASTQLHVFTLRDGFRTRFPVRPPGAPRGASVLARLSSGHYLVVPGGFSVPQPVAGLITRDTMRIGVMDPAGEREITWIGSFPNNSWLGYASPTMRSGVGFTRFMLGPSLVSGASSDRAWVGDSETGAITIYSAAGTRIATARLPIAPRAFSASALERAKQRLLASSSTADAKARSESLYDNARRPRTAPLFSRFIPATEGQLGIELFEEEDLVVPRSLIVLDRDGKAVAGLIVPARVALHEIGTDYALGVHTDDDGVETVVQYRLQR